MARPACPAPMTTVVTLRTGSLLTRCRRGAGSGHLDGDVRRVGDDVIDRRALLRLGDERLDVLALRVGIDLVR